MLHVFSTTFPCAVCGDVAATVSLVPPGAPMPDGTDAFGAQWWRLLIDGGPSPMSVMPVREPTRVAAALESADVNGLADVNPEYANFRCPTCRLAYCRAHWSDVTPTWDDGFYDATWATCPQRHRVMIDD